MTPRARALLDAPPADTRKGKRDRAILAVFLYHGLRWAELVGLRVRDIEERRGVKMFKIYGNGSKLRYIPAIRQPWSASTITFAMLAMARTKRVPSSGL